MEKTIGNFLSPVGGINENISLFKDISVLKDTVEYFFGGDKKKSKTLTVFDFNKEETKKTIFMVFSVFTCILVFSVYVQKFMNKNNLPSMLGIGLMVAGLISEIFASCDNNLLDFTPSYTYIPDEPRIKEIVYEENNVDNLALTVTVSPYEKIRRQCEERKLLKF